MNVPQVKTYLSLVYPSSSSWVALCLIAPKSLNITARVEHRFTRAEQLARFLAYARFRNAQGWGIYLTPSLLQPGARNRRKASFQLRQQIIYLDCDHRRCLDRIQARYPYPTLVVRTSPGRHQVYWRLDQTVTIAQQERLMSAMAKDIGADPAATDVSRVLRLPSFWNRKPGRKNTVDIVFRRDHAIGYRSLWTSLPKSTTAVSACVSGTSTRRSKPCVLGKAVAQKGPLEGGLSESERDWYEVHRRLARGSPPEDVIAWLQQKRCDKRNPKYYAELTVRNAAAARG